MPPASPAIAAPPASRGPLALEASLPTVEVPGAFEASCEVFCRVFRAAPFPDREDRERVFAELPERRVPALRPFDFVARVRELRALVEEPLLFPDPVELRLERVLWVAICISPLFIASMPAAARLAPAKATRTRRPKHGRSGIEKSG
jgi:hypothetical protein